MKDGTYLLCPECRTLSKRGDWTEGYTIHMTSSVYIDELEGKFIPHYSNEEIQGTDRDYVKHSCGFYIESWVPEDFAVKIKNKKIVKVGRFWKYFRDELDDIAKDLGLDVCVKGGAGRCGRN